MSHFPFGDRVDAWTLLASNSAVGETGGISIEAHADSRGVLLWKYEPSTSETAFFTLTASAVLDTSLVVITPGMTSDPNYTLLTVCRRGRDSTGGLNQTGDYITQATNNDGNNVLHLGRSIYIPPGYTWTARRRATGLAHSAGIAFSELVSRAS